jgi:uncharacterized peroxidase-related enzyme
MPVFNAKFSPPMESKLLHAPHSGADLLLRGLNTLAPAERELIAIHVSATNKCVYCEAIHTAIAAHLLAGDDQIVSEVKKDFRKAPIPERLKALLEMAGKVRADGNHVTSEDILRARRKGATDLEIHDTLLIAAMFCMCAGEGWQPRGERNGRTRTKQQPRHERTK